jgi:thioredoxin-related protein
MNKEIVLTSNDKPHLLMFTQPDCKWCKKEAAALRELVEKCSEHLNVAILGFKGTNMQSRREGRFYSESIPFLKASKALLRQFKGIETSPSFVFLNQDSELLAKRVGYLQPSKLFNAVSLLTNNKCSL